MLAIGCPTYPALRVDRDEVDRDARFAHLDSRGHPADASANDQCRADGSSGGLMHAKHFIAFGSRARIRLSDASHRRE
jgi:hypothetical protein